MCLAVGHFRHRHNKFHSSAYVHSAGPSLMGDARQLCGSIRNLSKYRQTWLGSCRSCDPSRSATVIGISFYTILLYFFHIRIMLMLPSWMACVENGFRAAVFLNWYVREILVSMLSDDTSMTDWIIDGRTLGKREIGRAGLRGGEICRSSAGQIATIKSAQPGAFFVIEEGMRKVSKRITQWS